MVRMTLTETERKQLEEYRADVADRETAHTLAAEATVRLVQSALDELNELNIGLAKAQLWALIEAGLPNDHGGPVTHYPLFETALENERARRVARP
jgi:hypothetical protein